jgi:hypothetical protein
LSGPRKTLAIDAMVARGGIELPTRGFSSAPPAAI